MAEGNTLFPTALDTNTEQPEPASTTAMDAAGFFHDLATTAASKAIKALQTKVGINSSADTASLDYKIGRSLPNTQWAGNSGIDQNFVFPVSEMRAVPFWLGGYMTVTKVGLSIVTSSGNVSAAIYDSAGTRVSTSGAVACPAAGVERITVPTVALSPGKYFVALSMDNVTASVYGTERNIEPGFTAVAASHPCPATFTPSATSTAGKPSPALLVLP